MGPGISNGSARAGAFLRVAHAHAPPQPYAPNCGAHAPRRRIASALLAASLAVHRPHGDVNGLRELPAITVNWPSLVLDACALLDAKVDDYLQHRAAFGYVEINFYFAGIDALYYYSFIRTKKPKRIIEIGQGFSTRIALAALTQNASAET
jgi:hypothetical protein